MRPKMGEIPEGRLSRFKDAWWKTINSKEIQGVIQKGHIIRFKEDPQLMLPQDGKITCLSRDQMSIVRKEVQVLLNKCAIRKVPWKEARRYPGYYFSMFCVSKPNGKWRAIINLKPLNCFISKKKF